MSVEYTVINIGTLACNMIWGERGRVRTQHATTTYVETENRRFLVDPSLPTQILEAKLHERIGKGLDHITDIFCTTLHPTARRGIEGMPGANWWCSGIELDDFVSHVRKLIDSPQDQDTETLDNLQKELAILRRFKPAPDKFTDSVGIFPLPGFSNGCTGMLLTPPTCTVLITGPAAPTIEHLQRGMVWQDCTDRETAKDSLMEILEIADVIVPGFDNITFQTSKWMKDQSSFGMPS